MPFDGVEAPDLVALDKLEATRELIANQQRWCKGSLINAFGQMCILGALRRAEAEDELSAPMLAAIRDVTGKTFRSIERFNDHHATTHAMVMQVFDQTRQGLLSGHYVAGRQPSVLGRWRSVCRRYVTAPLTNA
ncbi:MAG TPA: hypothetical protein VJN67_07460 [Stellaceae bacterium]|nr:hypothetical protein [Stellaceae bacterium]